ncbi:hypothetical protein ACFXG4_51640 [Nocardia sp. NPDC059246]|uniref:hypothetical protein n=1 Tax=unclassified Nocardia TaxID=2637762 RepID=UPI0036993EA9
MIKRRFNIREVPTLSKYASDPVITEILETDAEFVKALRILEQAEALDPASDDSEVPDTDSFFETGEIPKDWLEGMAQIRMKNEVTEYRRESVNKLRTDAEYRMESVAASRTDMILSGLNDKLREVLEPLPGLVEALNGAGTALDAIESGTAEHWRGVVEIRKKYNSLRDAQQSVMLTAAPDANHMAKSPYVSDYRVRDTVISNLDEVFQEWREEFDGEKNIPFPFDLDEFLVWTVRAGANLWVPTVRELEAIRTERKRWIDDEVKALSAQSSRADLVRDINAGELHPMIQTEVLNRRIL